MFHREVACMLCGMGTVQLPIASRAASSPCTGCKSPIPPDQVCGHVTDHAHYYLCEDLVKPH